MAKIVVAGKANCPYYAKVELIADELAKNLPSFQLHKIVITPETWQDWLSNVCAERGWKHQKSPLVWRELVDRGGKGVLIGDANDFQEYAHGYYELTSELRSDDLIQVADENIRTKRDLDEEECLRLASIQPINVCVTCASQVSAYHFLPGLLTGEIFGEDTEIALNLLEEHDQIQLIDGLGMEAIDNAYPLLRSTKITDSAKDAFTDSKFVVLLDDFSMDEDEESWYRQYFDRYSEYSRILDEVALKNVKVLVACKGPVNFVVEHMIRATKRLPRHNIIGLSRVVENHVKSTIGRVLKVNSANIIDAIIWGNVHGQRYIDINNCKVRKYEGAIYGPELYARVTKDFLYDRKWLENDFLAEVSRRAPELEQKMSHANEMSRGAAIRSLLKHWVNGSGKEEMFSLVIHSDGWYDVPEGMAFSYPVVFHPGGSLAVVQDINLSEEEKGKLKACVQDLRREYEIIYPPPKPPTPEIQPESEVEEEAGEQTSGGADADPDAPENCTTVLGSITEAESEIASGSDFEKPAEVDEQAGEIAEEVTDEVEEGEEEPVEEVAAED